MRDRDRAESKARALKDLHGAPELLLLVNAWDVVSARAIAKTPGCRAIATASAAIAAAHGYDDGERIPVELMLAAVERIVDGVDLPVTADLEAGYGDVDGTVRRVVLAGVAGANLEDGMRPVRESADAVRTARRAADGEGVPLVINARTDAYLVDGPHVALPEALQRGAAYLQEGADCVFVPGCVELEQLAELASAFGPGRLSAMWMPGGPTPEAMHRVGACRVSFGPFAQLHAMAQLARATEEASTGMPDARPKRRRHG